MAALFTGLLTAYYFGLQAGGIAAAVTFGLFMLAAIVPGTTLLVYGVVALGVIAICVIGPRVAPPPENNALRRAAKTVLSLVRNQLRRRS